jgi:hypothetical protein
MAAPSLTDTTLSTGGRIGRNFSVVTLVPALCLTLWVYALVASNAWPGEPDLRLLGDRVSAWGLGDFAWLLLVSVVVGLFIHPLQFPTVQLLEGYWGTSTLARGAMAARVRHYRRKSRAAFQRSDDHHAAVLEAYAVENEANDDPDDETLADYLDTEVADQVMPHVIARDAWEAEDERYPRGSRMMPTRLGNALRRAEDTAGAQYGLDAIATSPHFALLSTPADVAYLTDAREQLDTAVRLCSVALVATVVTVPPMLTDGLWLLVALLPYSLAYVAYRAAVSAADEYTTAMSTLIDLNRFVLYERMGLPRPANTAEERRNNRRLVRLLKRDVDVRLTYEKRPADDARETGT